MVVNPGHVPSRDVRPNNEPRRRPPPGRFSIQVEGIRKTVVEWNRGCKLTDSGRHFRCHEASRAIESIVVTPEHYCGNSQKVVGNRTATAVSSPTQHIDRSITIRGAGSS